MHPWRQRLAAILEWSAVDKSLFVVLALVPILAFYCLGMAVTLARPDRERLVQVPVVTQLLPLHLGLIVGALFIAVICMSVRRQRPDALWVQHLATQYYTLSLVTCSYFVGPLAFCTGVVVLGAPVFGFILLHRTVVWWATLVGTTALVALTYATAFGLLPYAPAVVAPQDGPATLWWINMLFLFSAPHIVIILLFADQTVSWWRQREDTIRHLSSTDMLTGLPNRRSILAQLDREVARSQRDGQPLTVVLLDLDHFKRINDTWGHEAGDRALEQSARVLRQALRLGDALGRYGGEEFMMVLPGTPLEGARALMERCRDLLAAAEILTGEGVAVPVSASFGLAGNEHAPALEAAALIRLADAALYRAKEGGRNRVEAMGAVAA